MLAILVACGRSGNTLGPLPPRSLPHFPRSFVSVAGYSPNQVVYSPDLDRFHTKWWLGGQQIQDVANERKMLQHGYHFAPIFPTGKNFPGEAGLVRDVEYAQRDLRGTDSHYYGIGNEVNLPASDYTSPADYVHQFADYVRAIRRGDPHAKIFAPNISPTACCTAPTSGPYGTAGEWFQSFVADYKQLHRGVKPPIDVLSMHLYNIDNSTGATDTLAIGNYLADVWQFRHLADRLGYAGTPIWITELGYGYNQRGDQPLSPDEVAQVEQSLSQLVVGASSLNLQRLFLFTDNAPKILGPDGLRPLYNPGARSSPNTSMPLTEYGQIVAKLTSKVR